MVFWSALRSKLRNVFTRKEFDAEAVKLTGAQTINGIKTFTNRIKVANPTENNDAVNKQYVDNKAYDSNLVYTKAESDGRYVKKANTENLVMENTANTILKAHTLNLTALTGDLELRVPENKSVNLGNRKISGLATPTTNDNAANKQYVDNGLNSKPNRTDVYTRQEVDNAFYKIGQISTPRNNNDATNKKYVDDAVAPKANTSQLNNYLLKTNTANSIITAPIVNITSNGGNIELRPRDTVDCGNKKISNLANPTNNQDGATKKYVDDKFNSAGQFDPTQYYNKSACDGRFVRLNDNQTINGIKTFNNNIKVSRIDNKADANSYIDLGSSGVIGLRATNYTSANSKPIKYLGNPVDSTDAATKGYVDNAINNIPPSVVLTTRRINASAMRRITNSVWGGQRHLIIADSLATISGEKVAFTPYMNGVNENICADCRYDSGSQNIFLHIYRLDGTGEITDLTRFGVLTLIKN